MPAMKSRLNPSCAAVQSQCNCRSRNNCPGSQRSTLEPDQPPPSPLPVLAWVVDVPSLDGSKALEINGHRVHSKCQVLDGAKPGCTNHSCMYGGGLWAIKHDNIYDCKKCAGLASSSISAKCLTNGGICEPDHNAWVLVT